MIIGEMYIDEETKKLADKFASDEIFALLAVLSKYRRGSKKYNSTLIYFLMLSYRYGAIEMRDRLHDYKGFDGYGLFVSEDIALELETIIRKIRKIK